LGLRIDGLANGLEQQIESEKKRWEDDDVEDNEIPALVLQLSPISTGTNGVSRPFLIDQKNDTRMRRFNYSKLQLIPVPTPLS